MAIFFATGFFATGFFTAAFFDLGACFLAALFGLFFEVFFKGTAPKARGSLAQLPLAADLGLQFEDLLKNTQ